MLEGVRIALIPTQNKQIKNANWKQPIGNAYLNYFAFFFYISVLNMRFFICYSHFRSKLEIEVPQHEEGDIVKKIWSKQSQRLYHEEFY